MRKDEAPPSKFTWLRRFFFPSFQPLHPSPFFSITTTPPHTTTAICVSSPAFNPPPVPVSHFICFPFTKLKKGKPCPYPPGGGCLLSHTSVFHLVLHSSGENGDAKCQYLDSGSGECSAFFCLHQLAGEAVMSRPQTSWGQNKARCFSAVSRKKKKDRKIVFVLPIRLFCCTRIASKQGGNIKKRKVKQPVHRGLFD